jgi:sodium-dependent phosphate cotransporter
MATFMGEKFQNIGGLNFLSPVKASTKPLVELFKTLIGNYPWVLFALSLILLLVALTRMVKVLKVLVVEKAEGWFDRYLFKNALRAFLVGLVLTAMVQSSSITTSLAVPLAGAGLLTLIQIFPYTLGANIGTTVTAILAALVTGNLAAVTVAFSHLLFNLSGIAVWWPFRIVPITMAEKFAGIAVKKKIIPILYLVVVFFLIPIFLIFISS